MEFRQVSLLSDSLFIMSILNGLMDGVVEAYPIIWDIQEIKAKIPKLTFAHVRHSENEFVHNIARRGLSLEPMLWFNNFPSWIIRVANSDKSYCLYIVGE